MKLGEIRKKLPVHYKSQNCIVSMFSVTGDKLALILDRLTVLGACPNSWSLLTISLSSGEM